MTPKNCLGINSIWQNSPTEWLDLSPWLPTIAISISIRARFLCPIYADTNLDSPPGTLTISIGNHDMERFNGLRKGETGLKNAMKTFRKRDKGAAVEE